ncbi:membrane protein [Listeria monocytogenes]|nr:membrane protein [Listeria monocytogenes]
MILEVSRELSSSSGSLFVVSLSCAIETLAFPSAIKSTEIIRTTRTENFFISSPPSSVVNF